MWKYILINAHYVVAFSGLHSVFFEGFPDDMICIRTYHASMSTYAGTVLGTILNGC